MKTKNTTLWLSLAVLLVLAICLAVLSHQSTVYATYPSPKGTYRLVLYAYKYSFGSLLPVMPGGGGLKDHSGFVRLYDEKGKLYGHARVPWIMVADQSSIRWGEGEVHSIGDDGFHITFPKE